MPQPDAINPAVTPATTPGRAAPGPSPPPHLKKRIQSALALALGVGLVHLWGASLRIRVRQDLLPIRGPQGGPLLFALWHGVHFVPVYSWRNQGVYVVTSRSADGEILSRALHRLGFRTVRGSSSRGGTRALIDLARAVRAGSDTAIGVDGPKGPRCLVKPGIILLAKLTARPIVPVLCAPSSCWQFQSWDRFRLPLPFSRVLLTHGPPIHVAPDADNYVIEAKRRELEEALTTLQQRADDEMHTRVWRLPDRNPRDRTTSNK